MARKANLRAVLVLGCVMGQPEQIALSVRDNFKLSQLGLLVRESSTSLR